MKPVQFMTTVHNDADFEAYREKDRTRRKKITNHEKELQEVLLRIPNPIDEYNQRMGYSWLPHESPNCMNRHSQNVNLLNCSTTTNLNLPKFKFKITKTLNYINKFNNIT